MPGLNHVDPGGDALTLDLSPAVTLTKVSVGPLDNNAYLLHSAGHSVLIDAAAEGDRLVELIGDEPVDVIVTTHRHPDHWQGLGRVAAATSARLVCGEPDARAMKAGTKLGDFDTVWDGDEISLGDERLEVIGLVGHTPGSIALVYVGDGDVHIFTGDSLFPGGPGKTDGAEEFGTLMDDLETKVFARFGDHAVVHPGHGDDTTLGDERAELPGWRERGW